jgi:hypothetical protein
MSKEKQLCVSCDNVHSATRKLNKFQWRCVKHPAKPDPDDLLDPNQSPDPPYMRCRDVRYIVLGGDWYCPDYVQLRQLEKEKSNAA